MREHTRENMSAELRAELERIEAHEEQLKLKELLAHEVVSRTAYVRSNFSNYKSDQSKNPFGIEFWIDQMGAIDKADLREELLARFSDDVGGQLNLIVAAERSMRAFADELSEMIASAS